MLTSWLISRSVKWVFFIIVSVNAWRFDISILVSLSLLFLQNYFYLNNSLFWVFSPILKSGLLIKTLSKISFSEIFMHFQEEKFIPWQNGKCALETNLKCPFEDNYTYGTNLSYAAFSFLHYAYFFGKTVKKKSFKCWYHL